MAKRHAHRPGDWESIAVRLDEIISAHSGEDPFEEALTLLVARLAHEVTAPRRRFGGTAAEVDSMLAAARGRWPGLIEEGVRTRLSGDELARCAAVLDGARLLDGELVGLDAVFEHIVTRVAKGQKGQYFTPRHVIREVVAMMRPAAGEHVVDPACGSGGFLCHALRAAPRCVAWGFDQDPRAVRVARVMLAASGAPAAQATRADSLRRGELEARVRRDVPRFAGFDLVLTNPPFAGDVGDAYGDYELARGRRVERDVLFVERMIGLLRPGGRYAIVLPHNKVGGDAWAFVRAWLLTHSQVVAVLGLGRNTFQPHTGQKACVVIGKKRAHPEPDLRRRRDEEILFFMGDRDGKDHRGRLVRDAAGEVDCDLGEATALVQARLSALAEAA
jgi:type I restriction enzyme M protein